MAMDQPSTPADNLLDYLDSHGLPSQTNSNRSNENKDNDNASSDSDKDHIASEETLTNDDTQSSLGETPQREGKASAQLPEVQVSRQSLSEYKASKRRDRQARMTSMITNKITLEEEKEITIEEPNEYLRSASWQPAPSSDRSIATFSSFSAEDYVDNSVPTLPTANIDPTKKVTKRLPSGDSHAPKAIKGDRKEHNETELEAKCKPTLCSPQQEQSVDDIHRAYQILRQQQSPRSNVKVNIPLSGEDMKLEFATLISRNHTTGVVPPNHGVASNRSWAPTSLESDDLTLLQDDDSDDTASSPERNARSRMAQNVRRNMATASPPGSPAAAPRVFEDRARKTEYARAGIAARRSREGGSLPSQSEHGTNSTREHTQRPASLNPFIDDDDPQAATRRLEAELIRKSMSTNDADRPMQENGLEGNRRPNVRGGYDRTVPGAHGIAAPAAFQQRRGDRREDLARYDSYLTNQDNYLVTATIVKEEEDEEERRLARDRSQRFRQLETRQADLEEQISEQKRLILAHHEELNRLKNSRDNVVLAEVIGQADAELDRKIQQRESIIAAKKAELDSLMFPGMDWLKRSDKKKKGGIMSKLNPFRKNNIESIGELDDSNHSLQTTSTHSRRQIGSQHKQPFGSDTSLREEYESGGEDENSAADTNAELDLSNRESLMLETKKRSERFIAPEKLPFEDNTIAELKQLAEEGNVDITGCVEREQIVKKLQSAGVKPKKKGALNKIFGISKSSKNSLGKSSTHSATKSPKKESKRKIDSPPVSMSTPILAEKRDCCYIPKQADKFDGISISQLKKIARDHNVDVSTCSDRCDLVNMLYAAGMRPPGQGDSSTDRFDEFSISELKTLARANRVDISSCVEKSQIVGALNVAGVRPPNKVTPMYPGGGTWDSLSVSEVKKLARERNVDVSQCVEKSEIITMLRRAGVAPSSHAPRLTRSELSGWRPAQLQILANHVGGPSSGSAGSKELINKILHVVNEEKKNLRAPIRSIVSFCSAPLAKLRTFAHEKRVDISGCVEKDEILRRIIHAYIR